MICVSIGRTRHKMMVAEHRALAERGAQLVELRLDFLQHSPELGRLIENRPTPVVITCRRAEDRGRWRGTEHQRQALLRSAIVAGVEYVDLEEDIAGKIPRYGTTKRIVSYHNFEETPDDLKGIYRRLRRMDPDIIKLATMANSPADNVRMLQLVAGADIPTVGFCMGELGIPSRILCGKYGAPLTYATFSKERELAPGQLSFDEMQNLYRYPRITRSTQVFGVVGDPIAHSLSPLLHNMAFQQEGLDCVYLPFRVPKDTLKETLREFEWLDIRGYSVTIPHKEEVLKFAQVRHEPAEDIGAANTLFKDPAGVWHAANTDYDAALQSIRLGLRRSAEGDESLDGRRVLLLGAGGAARAIALGLVRAGAGLTISNRTQDRAKKLAEELDCQYIQWENRGTVSAEILVNCTPVGMHPNVDEIPFAANWLREGMLVFDTIYNPENTLLLKEARERHCRVVSGVEMFVRQAAAQFEFFTGRPAPLESMRDTLRRGISPVGRL